MKYFILALLMIFGGCSNTSLKISQAEQIDYPEGIDILFYSQNLKSNLEIINARMVNARNVKQVQLMINNKSSKTYNIFVNHEWSDIRGAIISKNSFSKKRVTISGKSAQRIVLNAPNYKSQNVIINISCQDICFN